MKAKVFLVTLAFLFSGTGLSFSEEAELSQPAEPQMQWQYVEIVSVDPAGKSFVGKYIDFETEQEKEITIFCDDKTGYENMSSLSELKPLDAVGVDFVVTAEGRNLAMNISLEKPDLEVLPPELGEVLPEFPPETEVPPQE
ncbi:MAG: hypothetical protein FJZ09_02165 [Candidatus Omnitrophica bacterium]|nr:hypothetical protein [Candidatus Omnitrophota bacterium]